MADGGRSDVGGRHDDEHEGSEGGEEGSENDRKVDVSVGGVEFEIAVWVETVVWVENNIVEVMNRIVSAPERVASGVETGIVGVDPVVVSVVLESMQAD